MKNGLGRRFALIIIPLLSAFFYRMWFSTCTIRSHGLEHRYAAEDRGKPLIGICWHYCVLSIFTIFRDYPLTLMVSASNDGEFLSRMVERLGFSSVRGSSNKQGTRAAIELIRELRKGNNVGLAADGSQGPARIAQAGPILLATKSGGTIVPMVYSASKYFSFKTWDKLLLPKPFSTIHVFYAQPIVLPEGMKVSDLGEFRLELENRLNQIYQQAWQLFGKSEH